MSKLWSLFYEIDGSRENGEKNVVTFTQVFVFYLVPLQYYKHPVLSTFSRLNTQHIYFMAFAINFLC